MAIFFHAAPSDEQLLDFARKSSYTTHPGIIAAEACSLLAFLIVRALKRKQEIPPPHFHTNPCLPPPPAPPPNVTKGDRNNNPSICIPEAWMQEMSIKEFLEKTTKEYMKVSGLDGKSGWGYDQMKWLVTSKPVNDTERCWDWKSPDLDISGTLRARGRTYNGYPVSAGYFGSYSLDGLALALWAVYHTTSFNDAVVKSVNLLGDADSHGSITGQLAGAFYGYTAIDSRFVDWVVTWDEHEFACRGVLLAHLGPTSGIVTSL